MRVFHTDPSALVPWAGRAFATLDAEGNGEVTGFEPGTFDASSGVFTTVSPEDFATATHLRAITLELRDFDLPAAAERVKRVTIEDRFGRVVREELHLQSGTQWSEATASTTPAVSA